MWAVDILVRGRASLSKGHAVVLFEKRGSFRFPR
jgi:hypothetical protein